MRLLPFILILTLLWNSIDAQTVDLRSDLCRREAAAPFPPMAGGLAGYLDEICPRGGSDLPLSVMGSALCQLYVPPLSRHYLCIPVDTSNNRVFRNFSVWYYDEPLHSWTGLNTQSDSLLLTPMKGYAAWSSATVTDSLVIGFDGRLNTGSLIRPLTRTWDPNGSPPGFDGWNLAGNPYPSATDWESPGWGLNNVDPVIYYFNGINYLPYNRNNHLGNGGRYIPPMQGFFVHVTSGNLGFLSVNNTARIHSAQPFYKSYPAAEELLVMTVTGNGFSDEAWIHFDSTAGPGFDTPQDAYKRFGIPLAPQLYSVLPDALAAINVRPFEGYNTIVPLGFIPGSAGDFILKAGNTGSFQMEYIYLEDRKLNLWQNLKEDSVYSFQAIQGDDPDRFRIHFDYLYNSIPAARNPGILIYSYENWFCVRRDEVLPGDATVKLFDMTGREVFSASLQPVAVNRYYPVLPVGCYIVWVISGKKVFPGKIFLMG